MGILKRFFGMEKMVQVIEEQGFNGAVPASSNTLKLERIAIQSAVSFIASAVSQCRFRTFLDGVENRAGPEYFLWNFSPNVNQTAADFLWDLIETVIYDGEALVIEEHGQLFIADTFVSTENGTNERTYGGISVNGISQNDRKEKDVLYFSMGDQRAIQLFSDVCSQYEKLIGKAAEGYEKTYSDKGILNISARQRGKSDHESVMRDLVEKRFKKFFSKNSAVLPLWEGYTYTPQTKTTRNTSEINDLKQLSDEIYNRVGQVLRVPPAMLKGEIANIGDVIDMFLCFGVAPYCYMLEQEIIRKRYGLKAYQDGSYLTVDMSGIDISNVFRIADKVDKLISCGVFSIDEVRDKIGEPLLDTEESKQHFITKNYSELKEVNENAE